MALGEGPLSTLLYIYYIVILRYANHMRMRLHFKAFPGMRKMQNFNFNFLRIIQNLGPNHALLKKSE